MNRYFWITCILLLGVGMVGGTARHTAAAAPGQLSSEVTLPPLQDIVAIASGVFHTCAVTSSGDVLCWGASHRSGAVPVPGLDGDVASLAAGQGHTCALLTSGGIQCYGCNGFGQLGDGTRIDHEMPIQVLGLESGVTAIAANAFHTCALTSGSGAQCWGTNRVGELGDSTTIDRSNPVSVAGLESGVTAVAVGYSHTCAVTSNGGMLCWGENGAGQLGDGATTDRKAPVQVLGLQSGVTAIAAAMDHTCALTGSGEVLCWGENGAGQLGDGTTTARRTPGPVTGLESGVTAITAGTRHTCALASSGGVHCWGANISGQLGDGTMTMRTTPVQVVGLESGITAIAAGTRHTCALTASGKVQCWGWNRYGQLGDGTTTQRTTPVPVVGQESGEMAFAASANPLLR